MSAPGVQPSMVALDVASAGFDASIDLTDQVSVVLAGVGHPGVARISALGSTCGLTIMRYEPGAVRDLLDALDRVAPPDHRYQHEQTTGDPNGRAHICSALLGTGILTAYGETGLAMSSSHRIVLFDFDLRASTRRIVIQP